MRIREIPKTDRPREKLTERGAESLTDAELLAIFIRTGVRGRGAVTVAGDLIRAKGSLTMLSRLGPKELARSISGIGPAKAAELAAAFELGKRLARGDSERPVLDNAPAIAGMFGAELRASSREVVKVLLLDTKLRLIFQENIAEGSLSECVAHPREIFRPALVHSAYAVVILHNHPSGDPAPSEADRRLTRSLVEAARLLQISLLDHLIIGSRDGGRLPYFSFREAGMI